LLYNANMRNLLRITLICIISFAVMLIATLVISRTSRAAPILSEWRLCPKRVPCYGDIVLGKTPVQTAATMVPQPIPNVESTVNHINEVRFFPDGYERVRRIDFIIAPKAYTAGEIIKYYGPPCAILSYSANSIEATYPGLGIYFETVDWRLESYSPVKRISTFIPIMPCVQSTSGTAMTARNWHGFRRYPRWITPVR
jgi:hypothetical protein